MPLTFRSAREADADAIVAMTALPHARGNLHVATLSMVTDDLGRANSHVFVVERDGDVVGYVRLQHSDGWLVEIVPLVVREPGAGIGWFAFREALRYAFDELRAHRVSLEVVATNVRARRLYEGFGFVHEGTWRDGYSDEAAVYVDLCAYGLLENEYRAARASRESPRGR